MVMRTQIQVALGLLSLLLVGCLERDEDIEVRPDGSTAIKVQVKADRHDELSPGQVPTQASGWQVSTSQEKGSKGKVGRYVVTAVQEFAAGRPLPAVDGDPDDPNRDLYVHFPTTVTVDDRDDGTYYNFRRVYPARSFAQVNAFDDLPGRQQIEKIQKQPRDQITDDQWRQMVEWFAKVEACKLLELAHQAYLDVTPALPQDHWLRVYDQTMATIHELDMDTLVKLLRRDDQQAIAEEAGRFETNLALRLDGALLDAAGYSRDQLAAFKQRLAELKKKQHITDNLQGQSFVITLHLPGEIVGSNATETDANKVTWRLTGKWMLDREMELLATSRVPRGDRSDE
jgi:hypothetical protein